MEPSDNIARALLVVWPLLVVWLLVVAFIAGYVWRDSDNDDYDEKKDFEDE